MWFTGAPLATVRGVARVPTRALETVPTGLDEGAGVEEASPASLADRVAPLP